MPVFVYRAADRRGQTIDGVMEAPDARSVVERLQRDSYFPIRVSPHADRQSWFSLGGSGRIGQRDVLMFTQQLATLLEARAQFADAVLTAVAYPAVVFTFGIGAIIFLMTFVIPRFATIFADLGQTVPLPTQILLTVSAIFSSYWWVGVLLALGGVLA